MPYFFIVTYQLPDGTVKKLQGYATEEAAKVDELKSQNYVIIDIDYES